MSEPIRMFAGCDAVPGTGAAADVDEDAEPLVGGIGPSMLDILVGAVE
jgi:hypothetical protein